ncbi:MAG TPA: shikimate kinase [Gemmatimonadaceae bacterium]|nr:shikimate kinase [Gemmatimonadaceae bacterium]
MILVGLPGSGKTTVGRSVADRLDRPFLDLDLEIERREGESIGQIFGERGEAYFRELERQLTQELRSCGGMIVSPGGGWVANPGLVALVRPPGRLIYLRVRPETAIKRLGGSTALRPLLSRPDPLGELKRLHAARRSAYEAADWIVDTELLDLQGVIDEVVRLVLAAR